MASTMMMMASVFRPSSSVVVVSRVSYFSTSLKSCFTGGVSSGGGLLSFAFGSKTRAYGKQAAAAGGKAAKKPQVRSSFSHSA